MSTFWMDNVKASLEVALGNIQRLPKGETLKVETLNEIIDLLAKCHGTFIMQCELQGFVPGFDQLL